MNRAKTRRRKSSIKGFFLVITIICLMIGGIATPIVKFPIASELIVEYDGSLTFGENNINGESYYPGDNPLTYYSGSGSAGIVESKYGHQSVLESDMSSGTFYKHDLFLNESYLANCEPSPTTGVQSVEWWWAFDYISYSDWTPSPTVWIYTDADLNPLNDTTVTNIAWVKPPGENDQISCQVYDYVTDTKPYRTPDSAGIDLSDTLIADKFYHFRITFNYDLNQITWAINGEEGWRTETFSTTDLAGVYGKITKIGFGAGYSYLNKHWIDSLSWTWDDNYELGDLVNPEDPNPLIILEWEDYIGTTSSEIGRAVWANETHVYTAGYRGGTTDAYITKSDSDGNLLWTRSWGGGSWEKTHDIVGDDEYVYITGTTISYSPSGTNDLALLKYHANGTLMWYKTWGNTDEEKGFGIFLNGTDLFVIGNRWNGVSESTMSMVLLKYDLNGNLQWTKEFSGPLRESGQSVFVFGNSIYTGGISFSYGAGDADLLLVKWDADGNILWNTTWGGTGTEWSAKLWIDNSNIYMGGLTESYGVGVEDAVLIKWDHDGNQIWNRTQGNTGDDRWYDVYGDETGIYTGGYTTDVTGGDYNAIVSKWSFDGDLITTKMWGASGSDYIIGVYVSDDYLYTTGATTSYGSGSEDCLLLKWEVVNKPQITLISPSSNSIEQGGTIIDIDVSDPFLDTVVYNWDGSANSTWSGPYTTLLPTGDGLHTLYIYANNSEGKSREHTFNFITDDTTPVVTVTPQSYYSNRSGTVVSIDIVENNLKSVSYRWDSNCYQSWIYPYETVRPEGNGVHILSVTAEDEAGNIAHYESIFIVVNPDDPPPDDPFLIPGYELTMLFCVIGLSILIIYLRIREPIHK